MIDDAINRAFSRAKSKGWDKIYLGIDLHGVVIKPDYDYKDIPKIEFYPMAKEALQMFTKRDDMVLVMYTCSHPEEIERYNEFFKQNQIKFDYVNDNPEVENTRYGNYRDKPYFDVLFEDKAGFVGETDWRRLMSIFTYLHPAGTLVGVNKLLELVNISVLKDGGSIVLETTHGSYVLDNGISSINRGKLVFKTTPNSLEIIEDNSIINDLIDLVIDFTYDHPIEQEYAMVVINELKKRKV